ncbi:hypothetical protein [Prauserella alba]|uniref:Uncharacterized protein n=1 Tax=Prauserella alba TaxID=176898 RepID=A0ABN1VHF7_9PSEU|nr:hypothetical protein [Prauserella alba]
MYDHVEGRVDIDGEPWLVLAETFEGAELASQQRRWHEVRVPGVHTATDNIAVSVQVDEHRAGSLPPDGFFDSSGGAPSRR